jgi:hypothetical protein
MSANLPSPTALAASWDEGLPSRVGAFLAAEAAAKDVDVVLGPTINLHRAPRGGRHFECYSEDPLLTVFTPYAITPEQGLRAALGDRLSQADGVHLRAGLRRVCQEELAEATPAPGRASGPRSRSRSPNGPCSTGPAPAGALSLAGSWSNSAVQPGTSSPRLSSLWRLRYGLPMPMAWPAPSPREIPWAAVSTASPIRRGWALCSGSRTPSAATASSFSP